MTNISRQGKLYNIIGRRTYASSTYTDKKNVRIYNSFQLEFTIQSIKIDFKGLNRQIEWLEISLVYDKSDQHLTIYDSYDVELAAKFI